MAEVSLAVLESALDAEGIEIDKAALHRAFRRISAPQGCEHCGQHVKVGVVREGDEGHGIYTACCSKLLAPVDEPEPEVKPRGRKRNV